MGENQMTYWKIQLSFLDFMLCYQNLILRSLFYNVVVILNFTYHHQTIAGVHILFSAKYCHLGYLRAKKLILAPLKFAQISIHIYIPGSVFSTNDKH